jgi:hypothetical protein
MKIKDIGHIVSYRILTFGLMFSHVSDTLLDFTDDALRMSTNQLLKVVFRIYGKFS